MKLRISGPEEILETTVSRLPLSKSISARAVVLNALTAGSKPLAPENLADCSDTRVINAAISQTSGNVDVADCGSAARFLTAYFAATPGTDITLSGTDRLNNRPIAPLVNALTDLGADISYTGKDGCLPISIKGKRLKGGDVSLDVSASSQFASALAMIAPALDQPLRMNLGGEIASMPYLKMTLDMLEARGVSSERQGYSIIVNNTPLKPVDVEIEPDWSAAAFWYQIAAITAGWVTLPGLTGHSVQGDAILTHIGDRFGVVTEFNDGNAELSATPDIYSRLDMDLKDYPDLVPALAVTGCLLNLPFVFTGIANLRLKESDRIAVLVEELGRAGFILTATDDTLEWEGATRPVTELPVFQSHNDHRIAMAFAPFGIMAPGIMIDGAEAVSKSYPGYWDDLRDAGFSIEETD